ncbi:Signal transducer and activator of transcription 3 [Varanus komodoensis]|nr:Signal transducer and activator of transcription 3 [Varanus komodoensis]
MSQWQQIQMLERVYLEQVHYLYSDENLPMEVRQYLAYWIEEQNWSQAVHLDPSQACCLFHTMLALLDDQLGRLVLAEENNSNMVLKHNLRRSKLFLQARYQDQPEQLANVIANLLKQEEVILSEALAASQERAQPQPNVPVTTNHEHNIEDRLMEMRKTIQGLKASAETLEDLQDTFDFRFKTYKILESMASIIDPVQARRHQELQLMINNLDCSRKDILAHIQALLGRSDTLRGLLLEQLAAWQDRQRQACMGATCDTSLGQLEKW